MIRSLQSETRRSMSNSKEDRSGNSEESPSPEERRPSPAERRRVKRAAFLRPMSLLVFAIGIVFFALTLTWWVIPLTLGTYAALVFLAVRDPLFWDQVLLGRRAQPRRSQPRASAERGVSPERRARRLRHGETRRKVEEALELHRRAMVAIEESGEVAQAALGDAALKLHGVAERLVDLAERREKAAEAMQLPEDQSNGTHHKIRNAGREDALRATDARISRTIEELSAVRSRV